LSGSGKTTFIRQYLHEYPAFDIQALYKELQFDPSQLKGNPDVYRQFRDALTYHFTEFIKTAEVNQSPIAIVESSGINQTLNSVMERYPIYTIWVDLGKPLPYDELFMEERPWAKEFNEEVGNLWDSHELVSDNEFNMQTGQFSKPLPSEFSEYFQNLNNSKKRGDNTKIVSKNSSNSKSVPSSSINACLKGGRYLCPTCHADFSKAEFLDKHFQRYPKCSP
jgi:hypothetical protein